MVRLLLAWIWQRCCRHTWFVTFAPDRLFLRCPLCRRETAGWEIGR